jgi:protein transport protein SEC61 subunit gamma-like protein
MDVARSLGASLMGLREFVRSASQTLKLAKKSDWTEFSLYLKLVLLGLAVVGTIGFLIQFVASLIRLSGS